MAKKKPEILRDMGTLDEAERLPPRKEKGKAPKGKPKGKK